MKKRVLEEWSEDDAGDVDDDDDDDDYEDINIKEEFVDQDEDYVPEGFVGGDSGGDDDDGKQKLQTLSTEVGKQLVITFQSNSMLVVPMFHTAMNGYAS